jgi:hypothetical protein
VLRYERQDANGAAVDLTGRTYRCQWRLTPETAAIAETAAIDTTSAATGVILASLTAAEITALGVGTWAYDLEETNGTTVSTVVAGTVRVVQDVSRT